jgi:hypothetical protein
LVLKGSFIGVLTHLLPMLPAAWLPEVIVHRLTRADRE